MSFQPLERKWQGRSVLAMTLGQPTVFATLLGHLPFHGQMAVFASCIMGKKPKGKLQPPAIKFVNVPTPTPDIPSKWKGSLFSLTIPSHLWRSLAAVSYYPSLLFHHPFPSLRMHLSTFKYGDVTSPPNLYFSGVSLQNFTKFFPLSEGEENGP